jgi:hypothetical protein
MRHEQAKKNRSKQNKDSRPSHGPADKRRNKSRPTQGPTEGTGSDQVQAEGEGPGNEQRLVLYIDVDGVLFGRYGGYLQLRPGVTNFLAWATENFECRWLTAWDADSLNRLMDLLYVPEAVQDKIEYVDWHPVMYKTGGIDPSQPCVDR